MAPSAILSRFKPSRHNHNRCVRDALKQADKVCHESGARLTPIRRRVLELVWDSHEPVLAYDLLDRLRDERHKAAPPTVYRALDFLLEQRLIHRIESLNAFVGCAAPGQEHSGQFLICMTCNSVAEIYDSAIGDLIRKRARTAGFSAKQQTIEVQGHCTDCARTAARVSA